MSDQYAEEKPASQQNASGVCTRCGSELDQAGICTHCEQTQAPDNDSDKKSSFTHETTNRPPSEVRVTDETVFIAPSGRTEHHQEKAEDDDSGPIEPIMDGIRVSGSDSTRIHGKFGDYEIIEEVARGGMGLVYRARHLRLGRIVALKVLRAGDGASEEDLQRFMREARSVATLSHPNIVHIYELDVHKGQHFFTMDFIEGSPLDRHLDGGAISAYNACELLEKIARSIDYAHRHGIIHRDIKPANIILNSENEPIITDFGLAVNLSSDSSRGRMTRAGAIMGTIPYIPPEQAAGEVDRIDARSDVYSLGAVLYEMLTGRPPFLGETQYELLRRIIQHDAMAPRRLNARVHPDAETICMKCLEKDPRRRYQTAAELADDCHAFLKGQVIKARPSTLGYRLRRYVARYPHITALSLLSLILLAAFIGYIRRSHHKETQIRKRLMQIENARLKAEQEKREKDQELQRNWRPEYSAEFDRSFQCSVSISSANTRKIAWIDPQLTEILPNDNLLLLHGLQVDEPVRGQLGIPGQFPFDFRLSMHLRIPEQNPGELLILLNTASGFRASDSTLVLRLGPASSPGAYCAKGGTVLTENAAFVFTPGREYAVEVVRTLEDNSLRLVVDNEEVLVHELVQVSGSTEPMMLALGARDGVLYLDRVGVSILGLSKSMTLAVTEMGDTLLVQREPDLAYQVYKRIMVENSTRPIRIRALSGIARALAQLRTARQIPEECQLLTETIRQRHGRPVEKGEEAYLTGLALSKTAPESAIEWFTTAQKQSTPPADSCLEIMRTLLAYPIDESADTITISKVAEPDSGIMWSAVPPQRDHNGMLELRIPANARGGNALLQLIYKAEDDCNATMKLKCPGQCNVWLNRRKLALKPEDPGEQESAMYSLPQVQTQAVRLSSGNNPVFLMVPLSMREQTIRFSVTLDSVPQSIIGIYGHLARVETALLQLRQGGGGQRLRATAELTRMQRDNMMNLLSVTYPEELAARGLLAESLTLCDTLLRHGSDIPAAWALLESLHALFPSGGRELAQRYHRLGHIEANIGHIAEATGAYHKAAALAPDWYLPRLEQAFLWYALGQDKRGEQQIKQTSEQFPDSLELHLAIARFYLGWLDERKPVPALALSASRSALRISEEKNPIAWDLTASALTIMGHRSDALDAISNALNLEYSVPRRQLFDILSDFKTQTDNLHLKQTSF